MRLTEGIALTDRERKLVDEERANDWVKACCTVEQLVPGGDPFAIRYVAALNGWDGQELQRQLSRHRPHEALRAARRQRRKVTALVAGFLTLVLGALWIVLPQPDFVLWGFPAAFAAMAVWSGARVRGPGGMLWLVGGIGLLLVTGLVLVATEEGGRMSLAAWPPMLATLSAFALGAGQNIFGFRARYTVGAPDLVPASRRAWRLTAINLTVQILIVPWAVYWMVVRGGVIDEAIFNAAFRFAMFGMAMGIALAISLAEVAHHPRRAILAALLPPFWCAVHMLESGLGLYGFFLQWALVEIATVLIVIPAIAVVRAPREHRFQALAVGLSGTAVLGFLAYGVLGMLLSELRAQGALETMAEVAIWVVLPAIIAAADEGVGAAKGRLNERP